MNIRSDAARTLAVSILSIAALSVSGAANAQHHGDSHSSGGGGASHSASQGGGGGGAHGGGGHGGYAGPGPVMRGPVGYRGPTTIQRGFAPSQAASSHGWNGSSAGRGAPSRGYKGGSNPGRGYVDHRVYSPVHGRGGWGNPGGWYGYRPYWSFIGVLPWYYTTTWWNGVPYYFADNSYYLWNDGVAQYQVVPPPANATADDADLGQAPSASADFYVYPSAGQSADQQSTDRYECHRWAVDQTGFDPTRSNGGVAPEATGSASDAYRRAEGACLQGRGYTVR